MVGLENRFSDAVTLDVQGYYKDFFHQARATLVGVDPPYLSTGHGRSYGMELLFRHQLTKNFFGWVSYSLSRTERDYHAGQQWAPGQFDQPHNLIIIGSYKLPF